MLPLWFEIFPLKSCAADLFYPPKIPWVEKYKAEAPRVSFGIIKQPQAKMGFKRGNRR